VISNRLPDKKFALPATGGFEQVEPTRPWNAIQGAGATAGLISLKTGKIPGLHHDEKADPCEVDHAVDQGSTSGYDGLVLAGGGFDPDALRVNETALDFVHELSPPGILEFENKKLIHTTESFAS